jgi:hypothetical protein
MGSLAANRTALATGGIPGGAVAMSHSLSAFQSAAAAAVKNYRAGLSRSKKIKTIHKLNRLLSCNNYNIKWVLIAD